MAADITELTGGIKFRVGDAVKLKGIYSPKMVVNDIRSNNRVLCIWFEENAVKEYVFSIDVLVSA